MTAVVLVGMPGSGKSAVGRQLAEALGVEFCDTDELLAEREGATSATLLRERGEPRFRELELATLRVALERDGVIATGGGIVTGESARTLLRSVPCVWLRVPLSALLSRVASGERPLLGDDPAGNLERLEREREPWYREVAGVEVDANRAVHEVVAELVDLVGELQPCG